MDFSQAVQTCFQKYTDFDGRASRAEYWWFVLFAIGVGVLLHFVSHLLAALFHLGMLIPLFSAAARRLHDTGRSGWWQLISLVPVVGLIVLIVFLAQEGEKAANAYGAPAGEALAV